MFADVEENPTTRGHSQRLRKNEKGKAKRGNVLNVQYSGNDNYLDEENISMSRKAHFSIAAGHHSAHTSLPPAADPFTDEACETLEARLRSA